ncbi:MAG: hypothetical protein VX910_09155 [Candidatus Latescibacterota bacterium]|nr:hypothetical protein [Candidatus Latescibacterota bacterium]
MSGIVITSAINFPAQLFAERRRHGVVRALVYAAQEELISPLQGNKLLETRIGGDKSLIPHRVVGDDSGSFSQIPELHTRTVELRVCGCTARQKLYLFDAI